MTKLLRPARVVTLLMALGWLAGCGRGEATPEASSPSAAVGRAEVARGTVRETVATLGLVEFQSDRTRSIALPRAGEVTHVFVAAGEAVRKGQPLAELGAVPKASVDAQRARIDLDFAEKEVERVRRLRTSGLATNADLQSAERALATSRAVLLGLGGPGSKSETMRVVAPEDGVVLEVSVKVGAMVSPGSAALLLGQPGGLVVRAGFDHEDARRLRAGSDVEIKPVFGASDEQPLRTRLPRLPEMINVASQQVEAVIPLSEPPPPWMTAGSRVQVLATVESRDDAIVLPRSALLTREGVTGAFVIEAGKARWRAIELGVLGENSVEARAGVQPGAIVATVGRSALEDGTNVRDEPAGTSR